jgi:hypothetical protein
LSLIEDVADKTLQTGRAPGVDSFLEENTVRELVSSIALWVRSCRMGMKRPAQTCLLIGMLLASITALARQAKITGAITDPNSAAVAGSEVQVANLDTANATKALTDPTGSYYVPALQPGRYRITVNPKGFGIAQSDGTLATAHSNCLAFPGRHA